jgi:LDH2 family malate/lactate/ureidoglycolate dehydrogenase
MAENQVLADVCTALLEECAREMGVTLEVIAKSSHRKALRDVVEGAARQKLAAALQRAVPAPIVNQNLANQQALWGLPSSLAGLY